MCDARFNLSCLAPATKPQTTHYGWFVIWIILSEAKYSLIEIEYPNFENRIYQPFLSH